jgi:hypothetical protein
MPASSARQVTATTPSLPDIHTPLPGAFIPKAAATVNAASLRKFHLVADMQQLFGDDSGSERQSAKLYARPDIPAPEARMRE